MKFWPCTRRHALQSTGALVLGGAVPAWAKAIPSAWPPEVAQALQRANVGAEALVAVVQEVGASRARLSVGADRPVNPASLEKLVTTQAALELLGPAWAWRTPVWLDGAIEGDTLTGRVVIQGRGDPKMVAERMWLFGQRLRQLGVRVIKGDIVIDQSAFDIAEQPPGQFDNEPLRPYNVQPSPFLLNQKSLLVTFTPQPARGVASVSVLPPLAGLAVDTSVPLAPGTHCDDWRGRLAIKRDDAAKLRFAGSYPAGCGERAWPMADANPQTYHARAVEAMWTAQGGVLHGTVQETKQRVAPSTPPSFEFVSPPLADVVRDINKYSNNTMAQQLFLTLALQKLGVGTWQGARDVVNQWLTERVRAPMLGLQLGNGAGLSRDARLSAALLARVLQHAWRGPVMPDLLSSLPASGVDGTLRGARGMDGPTNGSSMGPGRAHLKTGSLRDVSGVAGYVLGESGRRFVVVAIANHPSAADARPAIDALVRWAMDDKATS